MRRFTKRSYRNASYNCLCIFYQPDVPMMGHCVFNMLL
ncbi:AgrD family cyclic lactone autoinducer peptide [Mucilaginibacter sp. X4EP1]